MSSNNLTSDHTSPATQAVNALLGQAVRCTLTDGRTATGTLLCVDRLKNLILTSVVEERNIDPSHYSTKENDNETRFRVTRKLSQAMIPGKHLVKVEVDQSIYESTLKPFIQQEPEK